MTTHIRNHWSHKVFEIIIFFVVIFLVVVGVSQYQELAQAQNSPQNNRNFWQDVKQVLVDPCTKVLGKNCSRKTEESSLTPAQRMYASYSSSAQGKEIMYPFLQRGDIATADKMLEGYDGVSPRFNTSLIENVTWQEDPYNEKYWRFIYYSLRPLSHLLYAWQETGDDRYRDRLETITASFLEKGMDSEYAWDEHTAAFRTMVLINIWWKLREKDQLSPEEGTRIIEALQKHGAFLAQESHYETGQNHAVTEAAALYLLSMNFPELPHAAEWNEISKERLSDQLLTLIDKDGVLVENSPNYHFYVLRFYSDIYKYAQVHDPSLARELEPTIQKMIHYGTYIIQPDSTIPSLGASISSQVRPTGENLIIAQQDPEFLYSITKGTQGTKPSQKSIVFPVAGQTIIRSGWGEAHPFLNETYLYFDYGPYRTQHSHLDALSIHLFAHARVLIVDSGLFTLEQGTQGDYFHGTSSHNTVVVDDQDQQQGSAIARKIIEEEEFTYQSATSMLYPEITHNRAILLYQDDFIFIVDELQSSQAHKYSQTFHVAPGIELTSNNPLLQAFDSNTKESLFSIKQYDSLSTQIKVTTGSQVPYKGWCSTIYEVAEPCSTIEFIKESENALFLTVINFKPERADQTIEVIKQAPSTIIISIKETEQEKVLTINSAFSEQEQVTLQETTREVQIS